jgi:transposase
MRPQGRPTELGWRRLHAIELSERDVPIHVVANRLGVDSRSVCRWKRAHRRRGRDGLRARPASAAGHRTSVWTRRRIVDLIRHHFDGVYHADHVVHLLRSWGVSAARPQPRA